MDTKVFGKVSPENKKKFEESLDQINRVVYNTYNSLENREDLDLIVSFTYRGPDNEILRILSSDRHASINLDAKNTRWGPVKNLIGEVMGLDSSKFPFFGKSSFFDKKYQDRGKDVGISWDAPYFDLRIVGKIKGMMYDLNLHSPLRHAWRLRDGMLMIDKKELDSPFEFKEGHPELKVDIGTLDGYQVTVKSSNYSKYLNVVDSLKNSGVEFSKT